MHLTWQSMSSCFSLARITITVTVTLSARAGAVQTAQKKSRVARPQIGERSRMFVITPSRARLRFARVRRQRSTTGIGPGQDDRRSGMIVIHQLGSKAVIIGDNALE